MQVTGTATLLRTADEQGGGPELLTPYLDLMKRRLADGHGDEDTTASSTCSPAVRGLGDEPADPAPECRRAPIASSM